MCLVGLDQMRRCAWKRGFDATMETMHVVGSVEYPRLFADSGASERSMAGSERVIVDTAVSAASAGT